MLFVVFDALTFVGLSHVYVQDFSSDKNDTKYILIFNMYDQYVFR